MRPGSDTAAGVGARFELLLFLAWQAWNESVAGPGHRAPNWREAAAEMCAQRGITPAAIARHLVSTDFETLIELMVAKKQADYPEDDRFIHALEQTPSGNLRVYSAPLGDPSSN